MLYVDRLKLKKMFYSFVCLATANRQYHLLSKDGNSNGLNAEKIVSFNGLNQAIVVNRKDFSGQFNNEFRIQMIMKHFHDENSNGQEKEHIFCKTDEKCKTNRMNNNLIVSFCCCCCKVKNRHHTALFIQNGYLKLLLRKSSSAINDQTKYASEWMWKIDQINDNQWHSYDFIVHYPNKVKTKTKN